MNPEELINKLNMCIAALSKGNIQLKILGLKKAESERLYRTALAKKIFSLKMDKVQVSLIRDLSRGDDEIARLRLERDIADNNYYVCKSSMENLKVEIEVLRSKLAWLKVEYKNY